MPPKKDDLGIGDKLNDLLFENSFFAQKNNFIYFDVNAFPRSFEITGDYKKIKDKIELTAYLTFNETIEINPKAKFNTFSLKCKISELDKKLISMLNDIISKAEEDFKNK